MATWSENGRALGLASCVCAFALACTLNPLRRSVGNRRRRSPDMAQGFAEIVKKVTPAVVNIAVTGGGEGRGRGRKATVAARSVWWTSRWPARR